MRKSLLMFAAFAAATFMQAQTPDFFEPYKKVALRLPSVPLLVNDPYFSFWSPYNNLNDGTTKHWDNQQKAMDGLLRVDGQVYRFMGSQRSTKLMPIAPMGNKGGYTAKVRTSLTSALESTWMNLDLNESGWSTQTGPWGTASEYPYIKTNWTGGNSDRYIRRHVTLTAEDLQSDLWIVYSHDDVCQIYVNGIQIVSTKEEWHQNVRVHLTGAARASLVEGDNVIAFHVHNTSGGAQADIGLYKNALGFHPGRASIAGMADEGAWEAKVKTTTQSGTAWTGEDFNDEAWETKQGAFGTANEYPNVHTPTSLPTMFTTLLAALWPTSVFMPTPQPSNWQYRPNATSCPPALTIPSPVVALTSTLSSRHPSSWMMSTSCPRPSTSSPIRCAATTNRSMMCSSTSAPRPS